MNLFRGQKVKVKVTRPINAHTADSIIIIIIIIMSQLVSFGRRISDEFVC